MQQEPSDKNPNPRIYTDADIERSKRDAQISESAAAKHTAASTDKFTDELRDMLLPTPTGMLGYIEGTVRSQRHPGSTVRLQPSVLKHLFNHAGKPIPKEVEQSTAKEVSLPRKEFASMANATAKKAGYGVIYRAKLYLKTRFSFF